MHRLNLTPGKFSQLYQSGYHQQQKQHEAEVTPGKKETLEKQRKSIDRLVGQPKGPSKNALQEWDTERQQYIQQVSKAKAQNRRLLGQIQQLEKEDKNNKILEYEMYIVQLTQQMEEQKGQFLKKYKSLEDKAKTLAEYQKDSEQSQKNLKYKEALYDTILLVMESFSCFQRAKDGEGGWPKLQKGFVKMYSLLQPFIQEFGIEGILEEATKAQQKESVLTFPTGGNQMFRSTFNKDMLDYDVSTNKSQRSQCSQNFVDGNSYEVRREYKSCDDNHLSIKEGDEIRLLKRNPNGLWIGECGDSIGYFPEYVLT